MQTVVAIGRVIIVLMLMPSLPLPVRCANGTDEILPQKAVQLPSNLNPLYLLMPVVMLRRGTLLCAKGERLFCVRKEIIYLQISLLLSHKVETP